MEKGRWEEKVIDPVRKASTLNPNRVYPAVPAWSIPIIKIRG